MAANLYDLVESPMAQHAGDESRHVIHNRFKLVGTHRTASVSYGWIIQTNAYVYNTNWHELCIFVCQFPPNRVVLSLGFKRSLLKVYQGFSSQHGTWICAVGQKLQMILYHHHLAVVFCPHVSWMFISWCLGLSVLQGQISIRSQTWFNFPICSDVLFIEEILSISIYIYRYAWWIILGSELFGWFMKKI